MLIELFSDMPATKVKRILEMATQDIKANRIQFGRRTSREYLRDIINICIKIA